MWKTQKYSTQTNLLTSLDICFVTDNLNYDDINMRLPLYILSRPKEILESLKKKIFQVDNPKGVPVSI